MLSFCWKDCWSLALKYHKRMGRCPCRKNWVSNIRTYHSGLGSNGQEFGWFPAPLLMGCTVSLGANQAPTVQEFESQSQPPQSNLFSLLLLLLPRDCMKLKSPVNHRQALSRSHYSPAHVSSMGKINKVKIHQNKEISAKTTQFSVWSHGIRQNLWHFAGLNYTVSPYWSKPFFCLLSHSLSLVTIHFLCVTGRSVWICEEVSKLMPIFCTADYQHLQIADSVAVEPRTYDK